jgi:hypothetical protein
MLNKRMTALGAFGHFVKTGIVATAVANTPATD